MFVSKTLASDLVSPQMSHLKHDLHRRIVFLGAERAVRTWNLLRGFSSLQTVHVYALANGVHIKQTAKLPPSLSLLPFSARDAKSRLYFTL